MKATLFKTFFITGAVFFGVYLGGKFLGKGDMVASLCILGEVAIEQGYLSEEQFLSLTDETALRIGQRYPELAERITSTDRIIVDRLSESSCTGIVTHLINGMQP